jgi:CheY-like chemotaxis protein
MSAPAAIPAISGTGRRIRVFICDDVEDLRELLCLQVSGDPDLEVVGSAPDGLSALEGIAQTEPDVVLLDLSMPKLNGIEVMEELRGGPHWPRFVVLSAGAEDGEPAARAAGCTSYLRKPASTKAIRRAVHEAVTQELRGVA